MPLVTGPITSCVGAADANIQLTVAFTGRAAIRAVPSARCRPRRPVTDGRPTVTVVPAHNTTGVAVDPADRGALLGADDRADDHHRLSAATLVVQDADGRSCAGTLSFTELFDATAAIFRPTLPAGVRQDLHHRRQPERLQPRRACRWRRASSPGSPPRTRRTCPTPPSRRWSRCSWRRRSTPSRWPAGRAPSWWSTPATPTAWRRVDLLLDGALVDTRTPERDPSASLSTPGRSSPARRTSSPRWRTMPPATSAPATRTLQRAPDLLPPTVAHHGGGAGRAAAGLCRSRPRRPTTGASRASTVPRRRPGADRSHRLWRRSVRRADAGPGGRCPSRRGARRRWRRQRGVGRARRSLSRPTDPRR